MKLVLKYLRSHVKILILLVIFACAFALVFSLYNLPVEPVLYASLLCIAAGLVLFAAAFSIFKKKHRILTELKKNIAVSIDIDDLPRHDRIIEEDYRELVRILCAENKKLEDIADLRRRDGLEYFTLWAHQIKTPISAMRLLLQAERKTNEAELESELFKIEQYVNMALGYLRADSISSDLLIKKYDLDGIVKQVIRKFAKEFIRRKISLRYDTLSCEVLTDEKWLAFVLEQLISNALKYTKEGNITLYMDSGPGKALVIEDTGIGIRAEDLPRIFEKGFTGYNGRADKRSTGIGLYLVKRVINMLGHTIRVESELGKGTKVILGLDSAEIAFE